MQVLWHDHADMDVCKGKATEGSIRVVGHRHMYNKHIHSHRKPCNRLQEVIHC